MSHIGYCDADVFCALCIWLCLKPTLYDTSLCTQTAPDSMLTATFNTARNSWQVVTSREVRHALNPIHTADTDKTRLSCLVLSVLAVWTKLATRLSVTENFETVLFSREIRWGLLKAVLTCRQFCSHHRQDKTLLSVSAVWIGHYSHFHVKHA